MKPADATVVVGGIELARGQRSLPRPPVGRTVTIVARAKGHDDVSVLVDYFTVTPLDIVLRPSPDDAHAVAPPSKPHPRPKPKESEPLPSNPY